MTIHFVPRRTVLRMAFLSELLLISLALILCRVFNLTLPLSFDLRGALIGILAAIPMLVCNLLIFGKLSREDSPWPIYNRFKKTVVIPICGDLNALDALLIATVSGFAEEILFRGALQIQFSAWLTPLGGILLSSALFSYVHFIGVLRLYWQLALFYFLFGLYFAAILIGSANLLAPIVMHAFYNFTVILYLRYLEVPALKKADSPTRSTT